MGVGVAFRAFNSYRNRSVFSSTMLNATNVFVYMLPYVLPTCYQRVISVLPYVLP